MFEASSNLQKTRFRFILRGRDRRGERFIHLIARRHVHLLKLHALKFQNLPTLALDVEH